MCSTRPLSRGNCEENCTKSYGSQHNSAGIPGIPGTELVTAHRGNTGNTGTGYHASARFLYACSSGVYLPRYNRPIGQDLSSFWGLFLSWLSRDPSRRSGCPHVPRATFFVPPSTYPSLAVNPGPAEIGNQQYWALKCVVTIR